MTSTKSSSTPTTSTSTTTIATSPKRNIWILFASQTGNSEQAARQIASQWPFLQEEWNNNVAVSTLDDFLEIHHAPWSPIVILCLSSYGVGQAPLGGYRFRELCNDILSESSPSDSSNRPSPLLLEGLQFAILGFGDSKYTTFGVNPRKTVRALEAAGAIQIGPPLTIIDASESSPESNVAKWMDQLWEPLREALKETKRPLASSEELVSMQNRTCMRCMEINPDYKPRKVASTSSTLLSLPWLGIIAILMVIVAVAMRWIEI